MDKSQKKYIINGVEYDSLDQIPEEHRNTIESFEKIASSGKFGLFQVLRLLFSGLSGSKSIKEPSIENEELLPARGEKGFFGSTHFKIMIAVLVVTATVYLLLMNKEKSSEQPVVTVQEEPTAEPQQESEEDQSTSAETVSFQKYSLLIDDPNEPPYQVIAGLYEGERRLLRMDLPAGELQETDDKNIIRLNVPLETETNLIRKGTTLEWKDAWGTDDTAWAQVVIGSNKFYLFQEEGNAAGHYYVSRQYVYPFRDGALLITLEYDFQNSDVSDTQEFDLQKDIEAVETILATLEKTEEAR